MQGVGFSQVKRLAKRIVDAVIWWLKEQGYEAGDPVVQVAVVVACICLAQTMCSRADMEFRFEVALPDGPVVWRG